LNSNSSTKFRYVVADQMSAFRVTESGWRAPSEISQLLAATPEIKGAFQPASDLKWTAQQREGD